MAAGRTRSARVAWGNRQYIATSPSLFVFQLPPKLEPPLIEDGLVQARLDADVSSRCFCRACRRLGHIPYLQILDAHDRVVLADRRRGLVQEIAANIGDTSVNLLDAGFRLFPVVAELLFTRHGSLIAGKLLLVLPEGVEWFDRAAVAQGGETGDAYVDTDDRCGRMYRLLR